MKKPVILLDCRPLYNGHRLRGIGYVVRNLVPEIVTSSSFEFVLLSYKGCNPVSDLHLHRSIPVWYTNRPIIRERLEWLWDLVGLWRVMYHYKKRPDLTHFFALNWSLGIGRIALTVHDIFTLIDKRYQTPFDQWMRWSIIKLCVPYASYLLCVSEATKQSLEHYAITRTKNVAVAHNAVDPIFRPIPTGEKEAIKADLTGGSSYMLSVGGLDGDEPRKNIDVLLDTYAEILSQKPDIHLVMLGKARGEALSKIQVFAKQYKAERKIHIPGFVSDETYAQYFQASSLYVHVSEAEGFGLPLLQAVSCHVPVVALNNTSVSEVVGNAGMLLQAKNGKEIAFQCMRALTDKTFIARLQEEAKKQSGVFSWKKSATIYQTAYSQILKVD